MVNPLKGLWVMEPPQPAPSDAPAYTADGYIQNQDHFTAYTYRRIPACWNCCGCVAVYNLRHYLGQQPEITDALTEMEQLHFLHVPGPTRMRVMRIALTKYLPGWRETRGRMACLRAAERSQMGILRYHEQKVPHYVAYLRVSEDVFRFLNVWDYAWDIRLSMREFMRGHCARGSVRLFFWL